MDDKEVFITTVDNPFDPETEFDKWHQFDIQNGYNTNELVARLTRDTEYLSEYERAIEIEAAIDTVCRWFPKTHRKIVRESA